MAKSADAFRTISEVSDWLETPAHVLRFWESKFSQVKPVKRAGGRRYYRPNDMLLLGGIKKLLHHDGMTIKGVQKLLREQGVKHVATHSQPLDDVTAAESREAAIDGVATEAPATAVSADAQVADGAANATQEPKPVSGSEPEVAEVSAAESIADTPMRNDDGETSADIDDIQPDAATSEDEAQPALPSFSRHQTAKGDAPLTDTTSQEDMSSTSSDPKPQSASVPDDPVDDIEAPSGIMTALAQTRRPATGDLADRLGPILDRMRKSRRSGGG